MIMPMDSGEEKMELPGWWEGISWGEVLKIYSVALRWQMLMVG